MESIFRPTDNIKEKEKRWKFAHILLKYRLVMPFFWIIDKIWGRHLVKKAENLPNAVWANNLNMFLDSYDCAVGIWMEAYMRKDKLLPRQEQQLRTMRNAFVTILAEDTAYRELFNCLCYDMLYRMRHFYGNGEIKHVFYKSSHDGDKAYFEAIKKENLKVYTRCQDADVKNVIIR